MDFLKDRHQSIMVYLLNQQYPVTINHIAQHLNVSPRTVRYDLKEMTYWLEKQGIHLMKVPKKGVYIKNLVKAKELLKKDLAIDAVKRIRLLTQEERTRTILGALFSADNYVSIGTLAQATDVSKSTCYKDVDKVSAWLESRGMELKKTAHKGYCIEATEKVWRKGLIDFLEEGIGEGQLLQMLTLNNSKDTEESRLAFMRQPEYVSLFSEIDFARMLNFVESLEQRIGMTLVDSAYAGLMVHIAIAVKRLREGEIIKMPLAQLEELRTYEAFNVVASVLEDLHFLRLDHIPQAEIGYITAHVLAAKTKRNDFVKQEINRSGMTIDAIMTVVEAYGSIHDEEGLKSALKALIEQSV